MDPNKHLGPADEQAFYNKIDNIFWKTKDDCVKDGPMTPNEIVKKLQDAIATVIPEKQLGGLGTEEEKMDLGEDEEEDYDEGEDDK
jgi:hypothetical protein